MSRIAYRKGYKYQLAKNYQTTLQITGESIVDAFYTLDIRGELSIKCGYAWDGPSGPTFDTPSSMRGSLVHDVLYQMIRQGQLDSSLRSLADKELYRIVVEDKMWKWRADKWLRALREFGGGAASPKNIKQIYFAP